MSRVNYIDPSARVGETSVVWHFATVLQDVIIGQLCSIGSRAEIGRGTVIGDRSRISANVFLPPNSWVGEDVFIGPGAIFTDDKHPRVLALGESYAAHPPIVENGASVGAGAIILPGITIGARARIAAGAIVTRDVPPDAMIRGEPARERERSEAARTW